MVQVLELEKKYCLNDLSKFIGCLPTTVMLVEVEIDPPRYSVHVYSPARDSIASLKIIFLPEVSSYAKLRKVSVGPSQVYFGVSAIPSGRETEHMRVILSPTSTKYEGVAYREMLVCSVKV